MKRFFASFVLVFIVIGLSACAVRRDSGPAIDNVYIVSNAEKYLRDQRVAVDGAVDTLTARLAKNESEGMQFLLRFDTDISNVSVSISDLVSDNGDTIGSDGLELFRQWYIYTKAESKEYRFCSGWYPDALIPLCYEDLNCIDISAGQNQGYWITVTTRQDQSAGIYRGEVLVTFDGGERRIPVEVEVWDFALPQHNSFSTDYGTWFFSAWKWMNQYGATDGEDYNDLHGKYVDFFLKYRIVSTDIPVSQNQSASDYVKSIEDYMRSHPRAANFSITVSADSNTGHVPQSQLDWLKQVGDILREKGLLDLFVVGGPYDEPGDSDSLNMRIQNTSLDIQSAVPEWKIKMTTAPRESLYGYVDPWCGLWSAKTLMENYVEDRTTLGEDVWWYGCVGPRAPFPTYHIPDAMMSSRLVHWMQKDWQITGNLYWASLCMDTFNDAGTAFDAYRDIWTDPNVAAKIAPGDGFLAYTGCKNDGIINRNIPVPTMRLESIRDGIEDYEYLTLLQNAIERQLQVWGITDITADKIMDTYYTPLYNSMGDFDHSPDRMLQMRDRLAHDIMNPEAIVAVVENLSADAVNMRQVRIYAQPEANVVIAGKTVAEQNMGDYSVYTCDFDMDTLPDYTEITVYVNGVQYDRTLKSVSDAEYIELSEKKIRENVNALQIPESVADIRAAYDSNMFCPIPETCAGGSLSEQLGDNGDGTAVVLKISTDADYARQLKKYIAADLVNTIPLVIKNEAAYNNAAIELLTVYAPADAAVEIDGNAAVLAEQTEHYRCYTFALNCLGETKRSYTVDVTSNGKTERFTKVVVHRITAVHELFDLRDETLNEYLSEFTPEDCGVSAVVSGQKLHVRFYGEGFLNFETEQLFEQISDFRPYGYIRMKITNTGENVFSVPKLRIITLRDSFELEPQIWRIPAGESRIIYYRFPKVMENALEKILEVDVFSDNIGTVTIEDIALVQQQNVDM